MHTPPSHCDILIIGGGPAGSTAASLLAREGRSCVVLEKETFPRYHIGESLLPTLHPMLDLIGAGDKVRAHGFVVKVAGFFHLKKDAPQERPTFPGTSTTNTATRSSGPSSITCYSNTPPS